MVTSLLQPFIFFLACLSLILAIVGIFVPLLPTTPLILLAGFLFSKSSTTFHHWILNHSAFGQMITDWKRYHVISRKGKIWCAAMIISSLIWMNMFSLIPLSLKIILTIFLLAVLVFVWSKPSQPRLKSWVWMLLILTSFQSHAAVEVSAQFWQSYQVYGEEEQNSNLSQTYAGSWAWYMFKYTALEMGFSRTNDIIITKDTVDLDGGVEIKSSKNYVQTDVANISLKQSLAPRTAFLVPAISMGYAKQWISGKTRYEINDNGDIADLEVENKSQVYDSCIGGVSLRIRLTQLIGLSGSYRSVIQNCNFKYSSNNTQVMAGLSWIF